MNSEPIIIQIDNTATGDYDEIITNMLPLLALAVISDLEKLVASGIFILEDGIYKLASPEPKICAILDHNSTKEASYGI